MVPDLPDDVLHLITMELWLIHDYGALYNCAVSCRRLATPVVAVLYRTYESASFVDFDLTLKWANYWRSMILSTIGATAYPYSRYSRTLDLHDLGYLFEEPQFMSNRKLFKSFFTDIESVVGMHLTNSRQLFERDTRRNIVQTVGKALIHASPLVEELKGDLNPEFLQATLPHLNKLRRLQLWQGMAVSGLGPVLRAHCPNFNTLHIYLWTETASQNGDQLMADFLNDLRPQSLQSFSVISHSPIRALSLSALSEAHGETLTELVFTDLSSEAMTELGSLKHCVSLHSISMSALHASVDLNQYKGVFNDILEWLRNCKKLRRIELEKFVSGASILTPLFVEGSIKLEKLDLRKFSAESGPAFYDSLKGQAESLTELTLVNDPEEDPLRISCLVEGVCKLRRLCSLDLKRTSNLFRDEHFILIASSLRQLESLYLGGWGVTDRVFDALSGLHHLERLDCDAISEFTFDGISKYIQELGAGNECLQLGILMANPQFALSDDEQAMIKTMIQEKVDGLFEYTTSRGSVERLLDALRGSGCFV